MYAAPRARGDGPGRPVKKRLYDPCSPRTRGWSRTDRVRVRLRHLLPAHAGMVPGADDGTCGDCAAPRARGDGPTAIAANLRVPDCSPRTRGWSRPDPAEASPPHLLPAHAGMVPHAKEDCGNSRAAPRARGDGPSDNLSTVTVRPCSPRMRGWSRVHNRTSEVRFLLPAHAGMVLVMGGRRRAVVSPRIRAGDAGGRTGCPRRRCRGRGSAGGRRGFRRRRR